MQDVVSEFLPDGTTVNPYEEPVYQGDPDYLEDKSKINEAINETKTIKDIEVVVTNEMGCKEYDLPRDRMGDIICMSSKNMTIGSAESAHDLSKLKEPLRSHGGLHEREVPFISNKKINSIDTNIKLNNYDAFYNAIAGAMR